MVPPQDRPAALVGANRQAASVDSDDPHPVRGKTDQPEQPRAQRHCFALDPQDRQGFGGDNPIAHQGHRRLVQLGDPQFVLERLLGSKAKRRGKAHLHAPILTSSPRTGIRIRGTMAAYGDF